MTIFQEEAERLIDTIRETVDWQNILDVEPMAKQFTLYTVCGIYETKNFFFDKFTSFLFEIQKLPWVSS